MMPRKWYIEGYALIASCFIFALLASFCSPPWLAVALAFLNCYNIASALVTLYEAGWWR